MTDTSTDDTDRIREWQATQERVCALVESLDADQVATHVPACPDWTVRDLLSHLVGLGARPLNDVVIHEQDLRGAVDVVGGRDSVGFAIVREVMAGRLGGRLRDQVEDLPPLALLGDTWSWCSSGWVEDAAVQLRASDFDLGRALTTRRTAEQLRSWTTRGDVTPYLDAFAGLGPLPDRPLPE